jgi:23S rRNA pseudouridine1911/1915/1917 synthase
MEVLFEDNHCIAVNKPHGQLTQSDYTGDVSLMRDVRAFIKERDAKPGDVFIGLLHRLDRPVGGIVLFAKTSKGASRLSEQFRARRVHKTYLAVVEGSPKAASGEVRHWLRKDDSANIVRVVPPGTADAKEAMLTYRVLRTVGGRSLVEVKPETGRPHQIRVAVSSLGTPIVDDAKYGASTAHGEIAGGIPLFASKLEFFSPVGDNPVTVEATPTHEAFAAFA